MVIPDFRVGDVDYAGWGYTGTNSIDVVEPHDGFQDEVEVFGERGGIPVTFNAIAQGGTRPVLVSGAKYRGGPYSPGTVGDLPPGDPAGGVILSTDSPVSSFVLQYSNGPDDAEAESTRETLPEFPSPNGVSNNQAIRVDGFTVCVGTLSVGDLVYQDLNGNGAQDPAEPGIADVTVTLADTAGNVVATTATNASGAYTLDRLPPYEYVVTVDQNDPQFPPGLTPSQDPDGVLDGQAAALITTSRLADVDFGFAPPQPSLAGAVYEDLDNDGVRDSDDGGIAGSEITLTAADGTTRTTATDQTGAYLFDNVAAGTYTVAETQPVGYLDGKDTVGSMGGTADLVNDKITAITLARGDVATGYDFGEIPEARLGDVVWNDLDRDGSQDADEPGIDGVTVTLTGTDDLAAPVSATTTTAEDGLYRFDNLRPGTYVVTFTTAAGYQPTGADLGGDETTDSDGADEAVTLSVGEANLTVDSGFQQLAGPSGQVYIDSNDNGVRDSGEAPIPGTIITATGPNGTVTTTTGRDGSYGFVGLPFGTYTLTETQPGGYIDGKDKLGSAGGTLGNDTVTVTLGIGGATGYDFGELRSASLGDFVWEDLDADGTQDPGEPGIVGVAVTLSGLDDRGTAVNRAATTDTTGAYLFSDLRAGSYTVGFATPVGLVATVANVADDETDSDGSSVAKTLAWGDANVSVDSGYVRHSGIAGTVYVDGDNDGVLDPGETPIPGTTVTLTGTDGAANPVSVSTTTGANGMYRFAELLPGTYTIAEAQPAGFLDGTDSAGTAGGTVGDDKIAAMTLASSTTSVNNNFGELVPASISGAVFEETLGQPTPVGQKPIPGTTIALTCTDDLGAPVNLTTTSAADGSYRFDGLRPGTCLITQTQPPGFVSAANTPATEIPVSLTGGSMSTGNYFGELRVGLIGNLVWEDLDGDGIQDPGEPGIADVTITLTGPAGSGAPVVLTDTTDATGAYGFDLLIPGSYTVAFTPPAGFVPTGEDVGADDTKDSDGLSETVTVGSAESNLTVDSGLYRPASVGDLVWNDRDGDGTQDPGEPGIAGVTVALTAEGEALSGPDTAARTILLAVAATTVTTTGPDGSYLFDGLAPGSFTVTFSPPPGADPSPADVGNDGGDSDGLAVAVTLKSGEANSITDSGFFLPASIAGAVYVDADDDGVFDPTETPIPGAAVTLTGTDATGNQIVRTVTTSIGGAYLFDRLTPGTYVVNETQPTAFLDGRDTVGNMGGALGNDTLAAIVLASGDVAAKYDFGELRPATITGTVFEETTGSPNPTGQPGIPNVTLALTCADGAGVPTTQTTSTGADGRYRFAGVRPGTCKIVQAQPPGYISAPNTPAREIPVAVVEGATSAGNNFGELRTSWLGDLVWDDLDGDGAQDSGEPGIVGVTVTLTGTDYLGKPVALTTTTTANGTYLFDQLQPGTYEVGFVTPAGFVATPADKGADGLDSDGADETVTLKSGESELTVDSGFYLPQTLSGTVYFDADHDGKLSEGDPGTADVEIRLFDATGKPLTTTRTNADGCYSFASLPPGTYTVAETQPEAFADGPDSAGPRGGVVKPDSVVGITLRSGDWRPPTTSASGVGR